MMKVNIITLGCSKNTVDSENIAGHLRKNGFDVVFDKTGRADIVIINTCGFIGDAKVESIDTILGELERKKRARKPVKVIVCGCLSERYRNELLEEFPEVDALYGVHEWNRLIDDIISGQSQKFESERLASTPKHYAYLKISEGCDRHCSYCAIPMIRGRHVSRPMEELVEEAKKLVADGVKELILIAQDTTFYGVDMYGKQCLGELMTRIAEESGAEWIRLHYTFPTSFPHDVIETMKKYGNICNYIDIPLQHVSTHILESMKRGIDEAGTVALIEKFRREIPDVSIRTTLIVGYPGETEEDFRKLMSFVETQRFDRMGAFVYSPEEGTPACDLQETLSEEEKQSRLDELMALQEKISFERNCEKIGRTVKVIIDRKEGGFYVGRTQYDSPEVDNEVLVKTSRKLMLGDFCDVKITNATEFDLEGQPV